MSDSPYPFRRRLLIQSFAFLTGLPAMTGSAAFSGSPGPFQHPGMLHSASDLRFIREKIRRGEEPWSMAWKNLLSDKIADLTVSPSPVPNVLRGPYNKPDIGSSALGRDSGAAYAHALIAALSPDPASAAPHWRQAITLLDAWSGTLQSIEGHDQKLLCGLTGYRFANAAELIRHAETAPAGLWASARSAACQAMLTGIFVPPIRNLFPQANGNWDAAMVTTLLCIGILTDDRALFERGVDFYLHSGGNGTVTSYIYPSGQCAETTRDQGHVQLGLGMLETACRVARNQGVDLYGAADNRLALGFEYTAKYNLGDDVPCDGGRPGDKGRGQFAPIYESVYQHYATEKNLPMPYTRRVLERLRPEGYDRSQPAWGTLTAAKDFNKAPVSGDLLAVALTSSLLPRESDREIRVSSPSGTLTATVGVKDGAFTYSLKDKQGHPVLLPSNAGIEFEGAAASLTGGLSLWEVVGARREAARFRLYGEHGEQNQTAAPRLPFEQRILTLRQNAAPHRVLRVEVRVYDEGMALCLTLPPHRDLATQSPTARERTEFALPDGAVAYASYASEDEYHPTPIAELKKGNWLPFTVQASAKSGPFLSIIEVDETAAGMPQTVLSPSPVKKNTLVTEALGPVPVGTEVSTPFPWRIVLAGETPARLAASNRLVRSLWPESALPSAAVSDWIKPGKAIRETSLSTPGGIATIDFAVENGLSYILFDAGWYGPENSAASDARAVNLDPARVKGDHPGLDLPKVIAYGKEKGIGVFLYVNRRALERQLPELAPLYESWGVVGIKFGFVNTGTVQWTRWMRDSVALCAKHHLLVDTHDWYRPVGLSGTYPNLLTQEGIRGNEHMPTPRHNCTLPFTRFLSGPGDYTICYRNNRLQTTDAHQMALAVLYYSPLTLLYWYGKPQDYTDLPEREYFRAVPTTWDETRWLGGDIGEWAAVARRSGQNWFIGAITNETARTVTLPLDFLPPGTNAKWTLRTYSDKLGSDGKPETTIVRGVSRISVTNMPVQRGKTLTLPLAPSGGAALWLTPA
ncbi:MAG: glycoside hydrolase family 97 catalytic domain-containing protein [Cytophagales bacterium]|nr:glycoside hydrolase family 97 catalytic domain-containing protein [Armatimonadota bacterium]